MTDAAVRDGQGASVELVRGSAPGTQISLSTPSGLSTLLTADQAADISRISGIVAGTPAPAGPALDELTPIVDDAGIRMHVVGVADADTSALADLATRSGGLSPAQATAVGEIDAVTHAIRRRFRAIATVDGPGPQDVTLTLGDRTYTTALDIAAPRPLRPRRSPASGPRRAALRARRHP